MRTPRLSSGILALMVSCGTTNAVWARAPATPVPVQSLLDDIQKGPEGRRNRAAQRLYHLQHPKGNAGVLRLASSPDARTRAVGLWTLSVVRPPSAKRIVFQRLDDPDPAVRLAATQAAGSLGVTRAATKLERLLRDPNRFIQLAAVRALGGLGPKGLPGLKRALMAGSPEQRLLAVKAVDGIPTGSAQALLRHAARKGPSQVRLLAAQALDHRNDPAGFKILGQLALRPGDKGVRLQAIRMLAQSPHPERRQPLQRALRDRDPDIRRAAADGLANP